MATITVYESKRFGQAFLRIALWWSTDWGGDEMGLEAGEVWGASQSDSIRLLRCSGWDSSYSSDHTWCAAQVKGLGEQRLVFIRVCQIHPLSLSLSPFLSLPLLWLSPLFFCSISLCLYLVIQPILFVFGSYCCFLNYFLESCTTMLCLII